MGQLTESLIPYREITWKLPGAGRDTLIVPSEISFTSSDVIMNHRGPDAGTESDENVVTVFAIFLLLLLLLLLSMICGRILRRFKVAEDFQQTFRILCYLNAETEFYDSWRLSIEIVRYVIINVILVAQRVSSLSLGVRQVVGPWRNDIVRRGKIRIRVAFPRVSRFVTQRMILKTIVDNYALPISPHLG